MIFLHSCLLPDIILWIYLLVYYLFPLLEFLLPQGRHFVLFSAKSPVLSIVPETWHVLNEVILLISW